VQWCPALPSSALVPPPLPGPRPEAPERPKKQKPNEDWLALSNSISMLGESDLLAIDEDLQDVRWDTAEPSANDFIGRIPSPLTALGEPPADTPASPLSPAQR